MYNKDELSFFDSLKEKNNDSLFLWNLINLGFPLFTVSVSILVILFIEAKIADKLQDLLFNGVLPLTAVNLLVAASGYLIKYNKQKEEKLGLPTDNIRTKLLISILFIYLFSSSLFVIQTIYSPFNSWCKKLIQILLSIFAIYIALDTSNKLFLLQEEIIDKTHDDLNLNNERAIIESVVDEPLLIKSNPS
ncbi:hypothetical protein IC229_29545 [Spirosoma sp. BT702]|uniref:Uncharacterized protein n=1 Tax=Spirosoma profusum TaxID=2771354 RepID=A0A927G9P0_9BACT|nr:hypothetical protein [Spirosoma profusum]MBD2704812.1 hypothetical protein [Spirosoma profusum]